MASELNTFHQDFDAAHSQNSSSDADKLVDQVRLYHAHWKYLVEVEEPQHHHSLVIKSIDEESYVV
jgi:hypothetical protein